jgi:hypothetical protein
LYDWILQSGSTTVNVFSMENTVSIKHDYKLDRKKIIS